MSPQELAALHARAVPSPWLQGAFEDMLAKKGSILVHQPGCFAIGRAVLDEAELHQIATDPTIRRSGLARSVLQDFEHRALQLGATRAFLEVSEHNTAAQALYNTAGWIAIGRRPGYYPQPMGKPADAIVMEKTLTL